MQSKGVERQVFELERSVKEFGCRLSLMASVALDSAQST